MISNKKTILNVLTIVSIVTGSAHCTFNAINELIIITKSQQAVSLNNLLKQLTTFNNNNDFVIPECNREDSLPCVISKHCEEIDWNASLQLKRGVIDLQAYSTLPMSAVTSNNSGHTETDKQHIYNQSMSAFQQIFSTDATTLHPNIFQRNSKDTVENETCYVIRYIAEMENRTTSTPFAQKKHADWIIWSCGFLSVAIISLSGVIGIIFLPIMDKKYFATIMRSLVGLGVGALSGTAVMQLIPECFGLKEHSKDYLLSSTVIWSSIWVFFVFESMCKIILRKQDKTPCDVKLIEIARKLSSTRPPPTLEALEQDTFLPVSNNMLCERQSSDDSSSKINNPNLGLPFEKPVHHRSHELLATRSTTMSSVVWMIIFGDGLHNFIDGVSIGAGFTENIATGVSISLAIICEEFPHELGDFAILINSGMPVKKALVFNFASACTAFLGLILGLSVEKLQINNYIFGFAGGLFLYISLADLIPHLNEMIDESLKTKSKESAWYVLIQQNIGIVFGVTIIFLITKYGDYIKI